MKKIIKYWQEESQNPNNARNRIYNAKVTFDYETKQIESSVKTENIIHSGAFMTSQIWHDDTLKLREIADLKKHLVTNNGNFFCTLQNLFTHIINRAYAEKTFVSPAWKKFKGSNLDVPCKVRLNNLIWRCWHLQFKKKRKHSMCSFMVPNGAIEQVASVKRENILLEGKYWRRQDAIVISEYISWRWYYKFKNSKKNGKSKGTRAKIEYPFDEKPVRLFMKQHKNLPETHYGGPNADFIQSNLSQFQIVLPVDLMDIEPFQPKTPLNFSCWDHVEALDILSGTASESVSFTSTVPCVQRWPCLAMQKDSETSTTCLGAASEPITAAFVVQPRAEKALKRPPMISFQEPVTSTALVASAPASGSSLKKDAPVSADSPDLYPDPFCVQSDLAKSDNTNLSQIVDHVFSNATQIFSKGGQIMTTEDSAKLNDFILKKANKLISSSSTNGNTETHRLIFNAPITVAVSEAHKPDVRMSASQLPMGSGTGPGPHLSPEAPVVSPQMPKTPVPVMRPTQINQFEDLSVDAAALVSPLEPGLMYLPTRPPVSHAQRTRSESSALNFRPRYQNEDPGNDEPDIMSEVVGSEAVMTINHGMARAPSLYPQPLPPAPPIHVSAIGNPNDCDMVPPPPKRSSSNLLPSASLSPSIFPPIPNILDVRAMPFPTVPVSSRAMQVAQHHPAPPPSPMVTNGGAVLAGAPPPQLVSSAQITTHHALPMPGMMNGPNPAPLALLLQQQQPQHPSRPPSIQHPLNRFPSHPPGIVSSPLPPGAAGGHMTPADSSPMLKGILGQHPGGAPGVASSPINHIDRKYNGEELKSIYDRIDPNVVKYQRLRDKTPAELTLHKERREKVHQISERKRRHNIQVALNQLQEKLPSTGSDSASNKMCKTRAFTLSHASRYIESLEEEKANLSKKIHMLNDELNKMNHEIRQIQMSMPSDKGMMEESLSDQNCAIMREQFESYLKSNSRDSWPFYIFSHIAKHFFNSFVNTIKLQNIEKFSESVETWVRQYCTMNQMRLVVTDSLRELCMEEIPYSTAGVSTAGAGVGAEGRSLSIDESPHSGLGPLTSDTRFSAGCKVESPVIASCSTSHSMTPLHLNGASPPVPNPQSLAGAPHYP